MSYSSKLYTQFGVNLLSGKISDFTGVVSEFKVALLTDAYTPNQNTHDAYDDISAAEISGSGYTEEGATLTTITVTGATLTITVDADNVEWAASTLTARYAVVYDNTPAADGDKKLIMYIDFGENKVTDNTTFKITWPATGLFTFTWA